MFVQTKTLCNSYALRIPMLKYLHQTNNNVKEKNELEQIQDVYAANAKLYDRILDVGTFGLQNYWKWELVKKINLKEGTRLLDSAGGQGAISIRCLEYMKNANIEDCELSVCDLNDAMMEQGKKKLSELNFDSNAINWIHGDIENLPFPNETFNAYAISFGFRGVNIEKVFEEAYRVLKPGSMVYCMEIHRPDNFLVAGVHWFAFNYILPLIGTAVFDSNRLLVYGSEMFQKIPNKQKLTTIIEKAGFSNVSYKSLSLGNAAIHWGHKL